MKTITLRLDDEVLDHFRQTGRGYQSRINEALKEHLGLAAKVEPLDDKLDYLTQLIDGLEDRVAKIEEFFENV